MKNVKSFPQVFHRGPFLAIFGHFLRFFAKNKDLFFFNSFLNMFKEFFLKISALAVRRLCQHYPYFRLAFWLEKRAACGLYSS